MFLLSEISDAFPWAFPLGAFVFGACVGSFLNVVILRNPRGESVLRPGSRCDGCGAPILWWDNLPILGWLLRRGRSRCCGARISPRYPIVELLTALLFLGCWLSFAPLKAVCGMLFLSLLVVASFIDLDHRIIPDWLTIGGAAVGLFLSLCVPDLHGASGSFIGGGVVVADRASAPFWYLGTGLYSSPLFAHFGSLLASGQGLLIGSGLLLWIALVAEVFLKKEAMGFGDVKFVGMIGAFCGWHGAVFAIFGGAIIGTLALGAIWLAGRISAVARANQDEGAQSATASPRPINGEPPFGPMLASAAAIYFFGVSSIGV